MPLANVIKKLIEWTGRIFTTLGAIVGLAGIGCLAIVEDIADTSNRTEGG